MERGRRGRKSGRKPFLKKKFLFNTVTNVHLNLFQHLTIKKRIPPLSLMHFDIGSSGRWKPSSASLPGLHGATPTVFSQPDVNFLIRPIHDF